MSGARIVAYIQIVFEESSLNKWIGWETSLVYYRKWCKTTKNAKRIVENEMDYDVIPDALMYYPPIYYFHLILLALSSIASIFLAVKYYNTISITCGIPTLAIGVISIKYFIKDKPNVLRSLIERNRIIWLKVLNKNSEQARTPDRKKRGD